MSINPEVLIADVQHNCHIADARHGSEFGLCTYLMKMREYYRWECGLGFTAPLDKDSVGDWLTEREALWEQVAEEDYRPLHIGDRFFDPFDTANINQQLQASGLIYSAGLQEAGKAHFFVAQLEHHERSDGGFDVWTSGRELARGLSVPPAMMQGRAIFLRHQALKQFLWEKYESWLWSRPDNAMGRALACYPFDEDVDAALEAMTGAEMSVVRAHEIGEYEAGQVLGDDWNALLLLVVGTPAELMMRAVRDHWADCLQTLPMLLERRSEASLHTFIGNLGNMRKATFPQLLKAYESWCEGNAEPLNDAVKQGAAHWQETAEHILSCRRDSDVHRSIAEYVETRILA